MTLSALEASGGGAVLPSIEPKEKTKTAIVAAKVLDDISSVRADAESSLDESASVASEESFFEESYVLGDLTIPYSIDTAEFFDHYELTHVSETLHVPREISQIPEGLVDQAAGKICHAVLTEIHYSHSIMSTIATPLDKGLQAMACYYKFKYGIEIVVCGKPESIFTAIKGEHLDPKIKTWGIIATDQSMIYGMHVTPIICHKKEDGTLQLLNLDSVKKAIRTFAKAYHAACQFIPNLERITLNTSRQSDRYSCRTDALMILKDALRDIESKKVDDLKSLFEGVPSPHDPKKFIAKLPYAWAKASQISSVYIEGIKTLAVGKKAMSIEEYKQKFKTIFERKEVFRVYGHDTEGASFIRELTLSFPTRIDLFLNYKGKKNFSVMANFLRHLTKEQSLHLEFLKRYY